MVSIRKLLFRPLLKLPAKMSTKTPGINKAAEKQGLHTRSVNVVNLADFDRGHPNLVQPSEFLKFVNSMEAPKVPYSPQVVRYLAREADVA
jgi:hypothetical protein